MKITTVVGARPQFIKASLLSRKFPEMGVSERLIHTGQHYDENMSAVFFSDLGIPPVSENFNINQGQHGAQTGGMLIEIEKDLLENTPDALMVYGDTNSTLAGALAASKLHIPVIHIEAGLRSFDRKMPEETNRVLTDHVSSMLLCPTDASIQNLSNEGISEGVHLVGDVMELVMRNLVPAEPLKDRVFDAADWNKENFFLATLHRAENTDSADKLLSLLNALDSLDTDVVFPVHPRTKACIDRLGWQSKSGRFYMIEPQGYMQMLALIQQSKMVLTDSGGLQKEAAWSRTPCVTLRDSTEWVETVGLGWNKIVGSDSEKIFNAVAEFSSSALPAVDYTSTSMQAEQIVDLIKSSV